MQNIINLPETTNTVTVGSLRIERREDGATGKAYVKIWRGKQARPFANYYFGKVEHRETYIQEQVTKQAGVDAWRAEQRAARAAFKHTLQIGDILYSTWGYEQTNVDFYQVIARTEKTVTVRKIAAEIASDGALSMTGCKIAVKDHFAGEPTLHRVGQGNAISIESYSSASPWDGRPVSYSSYA